MPATASSVVRSNKPFTTTNSLQSSVFVPIRTSTSELAPAAIRSMGRSGMVLPSITGCQGSPVVATSNPAANNLAFYDSNDPLRWDTTHTESFGIVWFPGVPVVPGPATVVLSPPGGSAVTIETVLHGARAFPVDPRE